MGAGIAAGSQRITDDRSIRTLKITRQNGLLCAVVPEEDLSALHVQEGDEVEVQLGNGQLTLVATQSSQRQQLALARDIMARRRDVLRELAKPGSLW